MRQISEVPGLRAAYFTPLNEVKTGAVFLIAVLNIVSKSVIIHAKASLFQNDLCSTISFQIPSKYTIYRPCFHFFCSSKSFKCLQNEPYTPSLFSYFLLQFQMVSNTVRMNHLPSLFCFVFLSSVSDCIECSQKASCCVLVLIFSVVPYRFRYCEKAPFTVLVFKIIP